MPNTKFKSTDKYKPPETEWGLFFFILALIAIGTYFPYLLKFFLAGP